MLLCSKLFLALLSKFMLDLLLSKVLGLGPDPDNSYWVPITHKRRGREVNISLHLFTLLFLCDAILILNNTITIFVVDRVFVLS